MYLSQQDSFLVSLSLGRQGTIQWQQKKAFSIALSQWVKRESFENKAVVQDKKQTSGPGLYQVYMATLIVKLLRP